MCCVAQESSEEERNEEKEVVAIKDAQVMAEEKSEETNLGPDLQEPRPISISSSVRKRKVKIDSVAEGIQRCPCIGL